MTIMGTVRNGVVVLESDKRLADGTRVRVQPVAKGNKYRNGAAQVRKKKAPSLLGKLLLKHSGTASGLPSDMAKNHDFYLHGLPKKKP